MIKTFVTLFFTITMSQSAYADWKDTLNKGWDSTVDVTKEGWDSTVDVTKEGWDKTKEIVSANSNSEEIHVKISKKRALELFDDISDFFNDITELKIERSDAPESSYFSTTKSNYDSKINKLLNEMSILINDPQINEDRITLSLIDEKIQESEELKSSYLSKSILSVGSDKENLIEDAEEEEENIKEYKESRKELIRSVKNRLDDYELNLDDNQVEVLLSRVDADDIIKMTTIFSVISELTKQLSESMSFSGENLSIAKKYYGFHVILLELQMYIQESYISKLKDVYISNLSKINNNNKELIEKTKGLIRTSDKTRKKIYSGNLKSQQYTKKVIDLYRSILETDLIKIQKGLNKINKNYQVALNTYSTVSISSDLAALMSENQDLFKEIMSLQVPELIPFENLQMQKEFESLSSKILNHK